MMSISSSSFTASSSLFSGQTLLTTAPISPSSVKFRPLSISASCASTVDRPRIHIASNPSLYEVLGVHTGATSQEIKTAYRRLARVVHPDVTAANGQTSSDEFMKVYEAYATLSDAQKRADYDRRMLFRRPVTMSSSFSMSSSSGRRWETDQCW
ncbi:chaperone protein dnaJ 11, chloroplastic-like [Argentina anserina]|uniref:chaperone protein dnaJ 11, chloroplastic-like n=1 Tax=Argentina anserina TaxID=57926 RepID=UPI00217684CC|nr:chaperone protein dnaJ 11, chloroplastic-like [Potentilla anserina]